MCPEGTRCTGTDDPEKSPCTPELPPEPCPGSYSDFQCIDSRRYCLVGGGSSRGLTASLSLQQGRCSWAFRQRRQLPKQHHDVCLWCASVEGNPAACSNLSPRASQPSPHPEP